MFEYDDVVLDWIDNNAELLDKGITMYCMEAVAKAAKSEYKEQLLQFLYDPEGLALDPADIVHDLTRNKYFTWDGLDTFNKGFGTRTCLELWLTSSLFTGEAAPDGTRQPDDLDIADAFTKAIIKQGDWILNLNPWTFDPSFPTLFKPREYAGRDTHLFGKGWEQRKHLYIPTYENGNTGPYIHKVMMMTTNFYPTIAKATKANTDLSFYPAFISLEDLYNELQQNSNLDIMDVDYGCAVPKNVVEQNGLSFWSKGK